MTDTAGVNKPSAMTPLAPIKVKISKAIRIGLISLIHSPLTGLPLKSEVESMVSVIVSISESSCWILCPGECLSRFRYRLNNMYKTKVPPLINSNQGPRYLRPDHRLRGEQARNIL